MTDGEIRDEQEQEQAEAEDMHLAGSMRGWHRAGFQDGLLCGCAIGFVGAVCAILAAGFLYYINS